MLLLNKAPIKFNVSHCTRGQEVGGCSNSLLSTSLIFSPNYHFQNLLQKFKVPTKNLLQNTIININNEILNCICTAATNFQTFVTIIIHRLVETLPSSIVFQWGHHKHGLEFQHT